MTKDVPYIEEDPNIQDTVEEDVEEISDAPNENVCECSGNCGDSCECTVQLDAGDILEKNESAIEPIKQQDKKSPRPRSKYNHALTARSGYMDEHLVSGITDAELVDMYNADHPNNKIGRGYVNAYIKHLIKEHGFVVTIEKTAEKTNKFIF